MIQIPKVRFLWLGAAVLIACIAFHPVPAFSQDDVGGPNTDTTGVSGQSSAPPTQNKPETYPNVFEGEFTPSKGFDIVKTDRGSLNISFYGMWRWLDQMPGNQTFVDHLGRTRTVKAKNDLNWHRTFVWLTGFFYTPRFRYNISLWSLGATQQTLLFGNLQYRVAPQLNFGVGIGPNLTARSTQGSWPYWASTDRQMAEEFFRGGFASAFWISGQVVPKLNYITSINTNLSQVGVVAANDSRDMAYSASLIWFPTTGEFGPRGGLGDLEYHQKIATRIGVSACHSKESRYAALNSPPNATQIRLSDGVFPFETGALADTVTVERLSFDYASADFGAKYKGFSFQSEFYFRQLSDFEATGPVPLASIQDNGFMVQAMQMVIPRTLALDATYGYVSDEFKRYPWEFSAGANIYPAKTRSWRLNAHWYHVDKSPTGSNFGLYTAGQTGNTITLGTDILL